MPPRPPKFHVRLPAFPLPIVIGTDICAISRIKRILRKPFIGRNFARRVLSPHEPRPWQVDRDYGWPSVENTTTKYPAVDDAASLHRAATFLAGRWAAKEAVFKAHPNGKLSLHDVLLLPWWKTIDPSGDIEVEMWSKLKRPDEKMNTINLNDFTTGPWTPEGGNLYKHNGEVIDSNTAEELDTDHTGGSPSVASKDPLTDWLSMAGDTERTEQEQEMAIKSDSETDRFVSFAPMAVIHGRPVAQVTISHDGDYATATCLAYQPSPHPFPYGHLQQDVVPDVNAGTPQRAPGEPLARHEVRPTMNALHQERKFSAQSMADRRIARIQRKQLRRFYMDVRTLVAQWLRRGGYLLRQGHLQLREQRMRTLSFRVNEVLDEHHGDQTAAAAAMMAALQSPPPPIRPAPGRPEGLQIKKHRMQLKKFGFESAMARFRAAKDPARPLQPPPQPLASGYRPLNVKKIVMARSLRSPPPPPASGDRQLNMRVLHLRHLRHGRIEKGES
ncbi:holo-[acyl-carrier protein] synthase [Zalerion maritima]|uniref:Holo-[acyl-carrier protein] synthase n=1 Tax=Zalerion maritima TaxID=339359 RepID=A0AAD5RT34_9PEZI|nr:holo-[acyl-carrier protein] synthase [Zalerion maritima]